MKKILPFSIINESQVDFKESQDRTELALELSKIYFKENLKRYKHSKDKNITFRPLNTFRNVKLSNNYTLTNNRTITLFVNKDEPKKNIITDTNINLYVIMSTEEYLNELYDLFLKSGKPTTDSFIDLTFKFTYTRTRVLINTIVGRFIRAISNLENKDLSGDELNIIRAFNLSFDKRCIISPKGEMYSIGGGLERFLKRLALNRIKLDDLSEEDKAKLLEMYTSAYNDYLNSHYNVKNIVRKAYVEKNDTSTIKDYYVSKFGDKFYNDNKETIEETIEEDLVEVDASTINNDNTVEEFTGFSKEVVKPSEDVIVQKILFGNNNTSNITFKKNAPRLSGDGKLYGETVPTRNKPETPKQGVAKRRR